MCAYSYRFVPDSTLAAGIIPAQHVFLALYARKLNSQTCVVPESTAGELSRTSLEAVHVDG